MTDMFRPSKTLLVKLGSIVVHAQEASSTDGHYFDRIALDQLMKDPEVTEWLTAMDQSAMLPMRRNDPRRL